jgi:GNAT superfamily N-acetyltransferase
MLTETIAYEIGTYYGEADLLHTWKIADDQGVAAELYVSIETGEIMNIEVRKDRRGEGLARALYEAADAQVTVYHAPASHRTPEGDAFANAVGGDSLSCTHGCC